MPSPEVVYASLALSRLHYFITAVHGCCCLGCGRLSAILTFTGTYAPRSVSHHHLALGIVALLLSHMLSVASLPRMPISSVHFDLAVGLAALGTASSFAAGHLGAFTPYAFLANDLVAQAALYTHHQYIGGFFMPGR